MQKTANKKDKTLDIFINWLNENGAEFPDIYFQTYKKNERGVHTKHRLSSNETLIKIPRRLLIYTDMGKRSPWGQLVARQPQGISGLNLVYICLYMLQDMHGKNRFKPYYDILPKKLNNFPLFWSKSEKRYLEKSHLIEELKTRKEVLTKDYHRLSQIIPQFSSYCSLQKYFELRTIIGSRNFGLWIDGKKEATMVPLGDMLNHSSEPDVKWYFEDDVNGFVMNSIKSIPAHREITDSYGSKCNRSYLIFYGFALEDDKKCRNTIFLTIPQPDTNFRIQNMRNQLISDNFSRNISGDFNSLNFRQLMNFLRISNANESELKAFIHNPQLAQNPYNKRNEAAALSYLAFEADKLQESYPLTLKQNKRNVKKFAKYSNESFATKLVIGEKNIINALLNFTQTALAVLLLNNRVLNRHLKNNINGYILTLQTMQ
jgi:hypothetical protein